MALPLCLIAATGWIPNKHLDLPPKGPWPWGAIIGIFAIAIALGGLLLTRETSSKTPSANSPLLPS